MKFDLRKFTAFLLVAIIAMQITGLLLLTMAVPSSTFTIAGGIYPGAPSYTVWKEGSTYYAKNSYGLLAYSSTNASSVINSAIAAAADYGSVEVFGQVTLTHSIMINDDSKTLSLLKLDYLDITGNVDGIVLQNIGNDIDIGETHVQVNHVRFPSTWDNMTSIVEIRNSSYFNVEIGQSWVSGATIAGVGVSVIAENGEKTFQGRIRITNGGGLHTGIKYYTSGTGWIDDMQVEHSYFQTPTVGINLTGGVAPSGIFNNYFEFVSVDAPAMWSGQAGYGIWTKGWVVGNYFINYETWDMQLSYAGSKAYFATDNNTRGTIFVGGMPLREDPWATYWDDNGLYTSFVNIWDPATTVDPADWALNNIYTKFGNGTAVILPFWAHPTTATWGTTEAARIWFCTTHNAIEYWNGTVIVTP